MKLVNELDERIESKKRMLNTTAPSHWMEDIRSDKDRQMLWEEKEKIEIRELEESVNCLRRNGF
jgi:hypothetical protein